MNQSIALAPPDLIDLLVDRIREIVKDMRLEIPIDDGSGVRTVTPEVWPFDVPPISIDGAETRVPFVVVRLGGTEDGKGNEGEDIAVDIIAGIYADEYETINEAKPLEGWRIPIAVIWRIRLALIQNGILGAFSMVEGSAKWTPQATQPDPFWLAALQTVWKGPPVPQTELGLSDRTQFYS